MKNLSREQMMESLGTVGEKLVANYLSKNHQVEISPGCHMGPFMPFSFVLFTSFYYFLLLY